MYILNKTNWEEASKQESYTQKIKCFLCIDTLDDQTTEGY